MSDPFENPNIPVPALQLRQQSIQQAIDFLNDPRVRHEDPSKALTFLRQRGITEEELREAFRRIGRPFPHPAPLLPYHPHIAPQRPARSSWTSIFLAITAAAGVYAAFREVMRRYVVPLYFPDVAQVEERRLEERRQADRVIESHEREIQELRKKLAELETSQRIGNERVDNLSRSVNSAVDGQRSYRSYTTGSDVIREVSHTITDSTRTEPSKRVIPSSTQMEDTSCAPQTRSHKLGNLSYSRNSALSTNPPQTDAHTQPMLPDSKDKEAKSSNRSAIESHVNQFMPRTTVQNGDKRVENGANDDDDFMAISPAVVEDSWRTGVANTPESKQAFFSPREHLSENDENIPFDNAENIEKVDVRQVDDVIVVGDDLDQVLPNVATSTQSAEASAVARKLFSADVREQVARLNAGLPLKEVAAAQARPSSCPSMDTPLSDTEES